MNISVVGVIEIQTAITSCGSEIYFQSFIKGHRKSGVISIKLDNRISSLRVYFLPVTATCNSLLFSLHIIIILASTCIPLAVV